MSEQKSTTTTPEVDLRAQNLLSQIGEIQASNEQTAERARQDMRTFLGSICVSSNRLTATQQAISKSNDCSMQTRTTFTVSNTSNPNGTANTELSGFSCSGNNLTIESNRRQATNTYSPPMLLNSSGQQAPGPRENWFKSVDPNGHEAVANYNMDQNGNKEFFLQSMQTFMQWNVLGVDITHDKDEYKPSDRCRDILYQRWIKQLSTIDNSLHDQYLIWISDFFMLYLPPDFWGTLPSDDGQGRAITFKQYVELGGPERVENADGYLPGTPMSIEKIKDSLTNGLTQVMANNGRGFVTRQTHPSTGFHLRPTLEKPTEEEAMNIAVDHPVIDGDFLAELFNEGANQLCPQNGLYLTSATTSLCQDAAKRQPSILGTGTAVVKGTFANRGDAAPAKRMPGENLRSNPETMRRQKLQSEVEPGTSVTLRNDFISGGNVTRKNELVLTSSGGSTDPFSIVNSVQSLLKEEQGSLVKMRRPGLAKDTLQNILNMEVSDQRKVSIVRNCAAMAEADEKLIAATAPRPNSTGKTNKESLKATIEKVKQARGLSQPQTQPTLSQEEKEAYNKTGRHQQENIMRGEMRIPVMATLGHPNAPNIRRVKKNMINGGLQQFTNITPEEDYFLVQVDEDEGGHYFITYNRNGQQVTYYPTGSIPPGIVSQMIIGLDDGQYLPLATVLTLDEGIRTHIADRVLQQLNTTPDGQVFIKAILDSLRQNPETILKIFANHKEAFFTPLTHQKQHAHFSATKAYKNLGTETTTHHLASIANELFLEGGTFLTNNLKKTGKAKIISDEISANGGLRLVRQILMAIMTLQQEEEEETGGGGGGGQKINSTFKTNEQGSTDECNIGLLIYNSVSRALLTAFPNDRDGVIPAISHNLYLQLSSVKFYQTLSGIAFGGGEDDLAAFLGQTVHNAMFATKDLNAYFAGKGAFVVTPFIQKWLLANRQALEKGVTKCSGISPDAAKFAFVGSQNETTTSSGDTPLPPARLRFDPRSRFGSANENDFPVLLQIAKATISSDSNLNISLKCGTYLDNFEPVEISLSGRVSVKRIRILEYLKYQPWCTVLETTKKGKKKRMSYIEYLWEQKLIRDQSQLSRPFSVTPFEETLGVVRERRRIIIEKNLAVDPGGEDDDDDDTPSGGSGSSGSSSSSSSSSSSKSNSKSKDFNESVGPIFSRKENGISHNNLSSDRGPRALEAVYKNIATMCLTVAMGLPGSAETKAILNQYGFTDEIIEAGTTYCLESTSIEGCKTGGDFLQIVQEKIMGMLFSLKEEADGTYSVENFGFISFDRIATIIGAIFKVPSIFISTKANNHAYGGLNITSKSGQDTFAYARRNPALMPRMSLFQRALDCYWLYPTSPRLRCERLHSILIAVIDLLYKDSGKLSQDWTNQPTEILIQTYLLNDVDNDKYLAIQQLMNKIHVGQNLLINSKCAPHSIQEKGEMNRAMEEAADERLKCFGYITRRRGGGGGTVEDFCNKAMSQQQAEAAAKQQAEAEAAAKQQAMLQEMQAKLLAHQKGEIDSLITRGQGLIVSLKQTLQQAPPADWIRTAKSEVTKGRKTQGLGSGKRLKASSLGAPAAHTALTRLDFSLFQAIGQAERFLADIATPRIANNPFFGRLNNTIIITIRDLLEQLLALRRTIKRGGGSRKRRHRRRKTRRNKKKRKKKTIKRRRKRGRKTRRK